MSNIKVGERAIVIAECHNKHKPSQHTAIGDIVEILEIRHLRHPIGDDEPTYVLVYNTCRDELQIIGLSCLSPTRRHNDQMSRTLYVYRNIVTALLSMCGGEKARFISSDPMTDGKFTVIKWSYIHPSVSQAEWHSHELTALKSDKLFSGKNMVFHWLTDLTVYVRKATKNRHWMPCVARRDALIMLSEVMNTSTKPEMSSAHMIRYRTQELLINNNL